MQDWVCSPGLASGTGVVGGTGHHVCVNLFIGGITSKLHSQITFLHSSCCYRNSLHSKPLSSGTEIQTVANFQLFYQSSTRVSN